MFDKKENNRSAITDYSQPRKSSFSLPSEKKRTANKDSNKNVTYMVFGIVGFVIVLALIYMFISYMLSIKNAGQLIISVSLLTAGLLVVAVIIKVIYPRRPIEKDENEDDL